MITSGTGTAANYGCPAAGKTGTANNLENAWFVGYTPRMSTAVWVGYPQGNIPMSDGFGGALAAPIWHDYMESASGGYCGDFPTPADPFHGTPFFGHFSVTGGSNTDPRRVGHRDRSRRDADDHQSDAVRPAAPGSADSGADVGRRAAYRSAAPRTDRRGHRAPVVAGLRMPSPPACW